MSSSVKFLITGLISEVGIVVPRFGKPDLFRLQLPGTDLLYTIHDLYILQIII